MRKITIVALMVLVGAATCVVVAQGQRPELVVQTGHGAAVTAVAFSPDGKILASAGQDNEVKLWAAALGYELRTLAGHSGEVTAVAFSPDGSLLATAGKDRRVRLWGVASGEELRSLAGVIAYGLAFQPGGKMLASAGAGEVTLWDVATGAKVRALSMPEEVVNTRALAFSPDGATLAAGGDDNSEGKPGPVVLWDVAGGTQQRKLDVRAGVTHLAFNRDGTLLAAGLDGAPAMVWEAKTGQVRRTFGGEKGPDRNVAFGPDGKTFLTGGEGFTLWDLASGARLRHVRPATSGRRFAQKLAGLAVSPDGRLIAVGGRVLNSETKAAEPALEVWDAATGTLLHDLVGHARAVQSVAFTRDGGTMAQAEPFGEVSLWDLKSGALRRTLAGSKASSCLAFSPDGRLLAVSGDGAGSQLKHKGSGVRFAVRLWDHAAGRLALTLDGHVEGVYGLAFSPDGRTLASVGTFDETVKLWSTETGALLKSIRAETHLYPTNIAYSPDGRTLVWGETASATKEFRRLTSVAFYDVETGAITRAPTSHKARLGELAFSPDGKLLATVSDTVALWDVAGRRELRVLAGTAGQGHTGPLTFSADGKRLVAGTLRGLAVWDAESGARLKSLTNQSRNIRLAVFLPGTDVLAASGNDAFVTLWETKTGAELSRLVVLDRRRWLVVAPDGRFDGQPSAWGKILWRFGGETLNVVPVETYVREFFAPGLLADILSAGGPPRAVADITALDRRQPLVTLSLAEGRDQLFTDAASRDVKVRVEVREAPPVAGGATGGGVRDVRLFRNGLLVRAWRGDLKTEAGRAVLETSVPAVAGENRLTAYAFNRDDIKSADAELTFRGPPYPRGRGTAYVIAAGVNKYANAAFDLRYAVPDAEVFAAEVREHLSASGLYERVEVVTLRDAEATKANILGALGRLAGAAAGAAAADSPAALRNLKPVRPEDTVVIFFAGHGTAQKGRFYFLPHDLGYAGRRTREEVLAGMQAITSHAVSDEELERALEGVDAGQLLLVLDACNSGQALESDEERRGPLNSKGLAQLAYEKGMYVLAAAQSYQAALETAKLGHGYLTYALVAEGLKKQTADAGPKDGRLTAREWFDYATERVPAMRQEEAAGTRQLVQDGPAAQTTAKSAPAGADAQEPRVYYRRQEDAREWVVSASAAADETAVGKFREAGVSFDYSAAWLLERQEDAEGLLVTLTQPVTGASVEVGVEHAQTFDIMGARRRFDEQLVPRYVRHLETQGAVVTARAEATADVRGTPALGVRLRVARGAEEETVELYWTVINNRLVRLALRAPEKSAARAALNRQTVLGSLAVE